MLDKEVDVLVWANINPNKRGSFEDFMLLMSEQSRQRGLTIKYVLGDDIGEQYRKSGIDFIAENDKKLCSPLFLYRIVKSVRPRCIHFHFVSFVSLLPMISKMLGVRSVVYTDHFSILPQAPGKGLTGRLKLERRKLYVNYIDYVIGVSDFVSKRYHSYRLFPEKRVYRIYNGVDLERFSPPAGDEARNLYKKDLLNLHDSEIVITYAGQFIEEKGIIHYAEAVKHLLHISENLCFAFVGDGPLYSHVARRFEGKDPSKIKFLGMRDDMEAILRASDILVMPSIWEEAFGLVAAEASACGVPVVASDIGGIPEVVLNEISGVLTPPGIVEQLIEALRRLAGDAGLRRQMGLKGREHAEKCFRLEDRVAQLLDLYEGLQHCLAGNERLSYEQWSWEKKY